LKYLLGFGVVEGLMVVVVVVVVVIGQDFLAIHIPLYLLYPDLHWHRILEFFELNLQNDLDLSQFFSPTHFFTSFSVFMLQKLGIGTVVIGCVVVVVGILGQFEESIHIS
jgi:hypothetical protein